MLAGVTVIAAWLVWRCLRDPAVRFLPQQSPASWIAYPASPDISAQSVASLSNAPFAVFRRIVVLESPAQKAQLRIRALENYRVQINRTGEAFSSHPDRNWKEAVEFNVQSQLRPGTNLIEVTVTNLAGPPLLWLVLSTERGEWISDSSWEVSYANAAWQPARVAANANPFPPGNPMRNDTSLAGSVRRELKLNLTLLLLAVVLSLLLRDWLMKRKSGLTGSEVTKVALLGLGAIWIVLILHNSALLTPINGFDIQQHLRYIQHLLTEHKLPPADSGWETHQPPLYYLIAALGLQICGLDVATSAGLTALRVLSLIFGLGQIVLVFASLRLLFPDELRRPLLGTAMAALLPAHLYHAHYITNETLLALLVSGVFYLVLRVLRSAQPHPAWCAGLGACLGAALLTKLTALIVAPVVFAVLLVHLLARRERRLKSWLGQLVLPLALCLLVSGWFYWGLWTGGAESAGEGASRWGYGTGWWQDDGYRTRGYFLRFGEALTRPLFSSFHSYWDGLYSTLWGDGLGGGSVSVELLPPWNYDLLALGYVLALLPTLAVVVGFALALRQLLRQPSTEWLLLLGVTMLFGLASIYFSLQAPGASQVRASFGLMLLVPFCALFAWGQQRLAPLASRRSVALMALLIWWGLTSVFVHWIPGASAQSRLLRSTLQMHSGQGEEAVRLAEVGLKTDPSKGLLRSLCADGWRQLGRTNEARELIAQALEKFPNDPLAHLDAAMAAAEERRFDEAIRHVRQAQVVAPDHPMAARELVVLLARQGKLDEALMACREALRIRPHDAQLQEWFTDLAQGKVPASLENR